MTALYVALGTAFGLVLSRSGAADYDFVQAMFLFRDPQLYGILAVAVLVTGVGLVVLRRRGRTATGAPLVVEPKTVHGGTMTGGLLFGIGWSMTGMCPGPMLVNLGEGKLYAAAALTGALVGAGAFGVWYPRLQASLRLPPLVVGTGEG